MVWQDVKEGYLRNYTIRFTNTLLDSIQNKDLSSFEAGLRHFYKIDSLRLEIKKGGEYKHTVVPKDTPRYNINYFYSSFKWSGSIFSSLKIIFDISSAAWSSL